MKLPIGYDDFGAILENKLDFVDKSLFIKEVIDDRSTQVTVITRPRRFGKTLNLSMLNYFLASEVHGKSTQGLFDNLKISKIDNGSYMRFQGQSPVINITFKDVKAESYDLAYDKLTELMVKTFNEHNYLQQSERVSKTNRDIFEIVLSRRASRAQIENSLQILATALFEHHGIKPWILIDEYDTPIQEGYLNGYYDEIIKFMRNLFGAALKTNPYLERAVITGILRISKESIFSDLNNIKVYSLLHPKYSQYFGFTEEEVADLLERAELKEKTAEIRRWYNGYRFGNTVIYNPWSIVNCIQDNGVLRPYWVNTSANTLIKNLLIKSRNKFKELFESLLQGQPVEATIDENMVFGDLQRNDLAALSLMLLSGYLKATAYHLNERGETICQLDIPNIEVRNMYYQIITQWLENGYGFPWYNEFLDHLLNGNIPELEKNLSDILLQTVSVHDTASNHEDFYHGLMLGLAVGLDKNKYELKSNKESGYGRYDIVIIPKDINKMAIIIELKNITVSKTQKSDIQNTELLLEQEANKALLQINQKLYVTEISQRGISNIVKIGLAFCGKQCKLAAEKC